jgi:hypothetical protein
MTWGVKPGSLSRSRTLAALMAFAVCFMCTRVEAHWLTELVEQAGTAARASGEASEVVKLGNGFADAARLIARLPEEAKRGAIAAEALPDGAWRFKNAAGETVTAASADRVENALKILDAGDPDTAISSRTFYIDEDTAFLNADALAALPQGASFRLAIDGDSYGLLRLGTGADARQFIEINPRLVTELKDRALFDETLWQSRRAISPSNLRLLSLDPAADKTLVQAAARGPDGELVAEAVDPFALGSALGALRGQMAIVVGHVEAGLLRFASGEGQSIAVSELLKAAETNDVHLIVLDAISPKQPGRTTLWLQTRTVAGLDAALATGRFGDFLAELARGQGRFIVTAERVVSGHIRLSAVPAPPEVPKAGDTGWGSAELTRTAGDVASRLAERLAGEVMTRAVTADLNDRNSQTDFDLRLVPGIPADTQVTYGLFWILGAIAFSETRRWWTALTRRFVPDLRTLRSGPRVLAEAAYWTLFTPMVGTLSFPVFVARTTIRQVSDFVRMILRPFRRRQRA